MFENFNFVCSQSTVLVVYCLVGAWLDYYSALVLTGTRLDMRVLVFFVPLFFAIKVQAQIPMRRILTLSTRKVRKPVKFSAPVRLGLVGKDINDSDNDNTSLFQRCTVQQSIQRRSAPPATEIAPPATEIPATESTNHRRFG